MLIHLAKKSKTNIRNSVPDAVNKYRAFYYTFIKEIVCTQDIFQNLKSTLTLV